MLQSWFSSGSGSACGTGSDSGSAPPSNKDLSDPILPTGSVAVLYATREGHTAKVASRIASVLNAVLPEARRSIAVHDVRSFTPNLAGVCGVVLAASVHVGQHESEMVNYVRTHAEALQHIPTLFISVSLGERASEDKDRTPQQRAKAAAAVKDVAEKFFVQTGFHPTLFLPVAGCLAFTKYNVVKKYVLYAISRANGWPGGNMDHDYEFTDWQAVEDATKTFAKELLIRESDEKDAGGQHERLHKSLELITDSAEAAASAASTVTQKSSSAGKGIDSQPAPAPASASASASAPLQANEQLIHHMST